MKEQFWLENYEILYKNYLSFFPKKGESLEHNLNALSRFSIYLLIVMVLFNRNSGWIYIPVILLVLVLVIYFIDAKLDSKSKNKNTESYLNNKDMDYDKDYSLYTGFYDSNGSLILNKPYNYGPTYYNNNNQLLEYEQKVCRVPTAENPFMNPPVTDLNTSNIVEPCNSDLDFDNAKNGVNVATYHDYIDDADLEKEKEDVDHNDSPINKKIDDLFNADLYRNVNDLFSVKNNIRQFYTVPSPAIPSDQTSFANWLYKMDKTCKEDQANCLRYEDLRFKRVL